MSNPTPATCAIDGHCINKDDTTNTCMRCGAVDGWIAHTGDVCPVDPETQVWVRTSFGQEYLMLAHIVYWPAITHYRLAAPVVHPEAGLDPAIVNAKAATEGHSVTYVAFYDYGCEGKSAPFYVGTDLEELIKSDTANMTKIIQKWQNGKLIGELK